MSNNSVIFFTTHIINKAIISEFKKICKTDGYDTVLCLDNSSNSFTSESDSPIQELEFYGEKYKCFLLDENIHKYMNLPNYTCQKDQSFKSIMWSNGDYRFYYIRKYFPNYDYYWQTEYDVFCNAESYKDFLDEFKDDNADLISQEKATNSKTTMETWYWNAKDEWIYKDVKKYSSFFPVVRLSSKAIDFLYEKRLEHGKIFSQLNDKTDNRWIHCEMFVPTELINNGFSHRYFEEYLYYKPEIDLNNDRVFEKQNGRLYHPIKGNYIERLNVLKQENKNLKKQIKELSHFKINILGIKIKIKRKIKNA